MSRRGRKEKNCKGERDEPSNDERRANDICWDTPEERKKERAGKRG
jgi:hypothetical protein